MVCLKCEKILHKSGKCAEHRNDKCKTCKKRMVQNFRHNDLFKTVCKSCSKLERAAALAESKRNPAILECGVVFL